MSESLGPSELASLINKLKRVIVVGHFNPDPDDYGSTCALALALKKLGKEVVCVNQNGALSRYSYVPGVKDVVSSFPEGKWNALIACDAAGLDRLGESLVATLPKCKYIINIDHHISNELFGTHYYVDPNLSSTSEAIYNILEHIDGIFDAEIATCLMIGIVGDTGSFRYSCTSTQTLLVAYKLSLLGASVHEASNHIYGTFEIGAVKLQAAAMLNLKLHYDNKVAEVLVTKDMLELYGATMEDTDNLAERARDIAGVLLSAAIRDDNGIWRVSLRSKSPAINVSNLAAKFGGGGHVSAAAFRSRLSLEELRTSLLSAIGELITRA